MSVRFVEEEDASFIIDLRTDEKNARFIHAGDYSVESQKNWIREYKKREKLGQDYYFIYYYNNQEVGVNRLYKIVDDHFTFGSWVFKNDAPFFCSIASAIIAREIAFDMLKLKYEKEEDGVHENNKNVIRFSKSIGLKFTGEKVNEMGKFYTGSLSKEDFEIHKQQYLAVIDR